MRFHIENMTCGGCARSVTKAVQSVDPEAKVAIDLQTRNVDVTSRQPVSAFESTLAKVGYPTLNTTV